MALSISFVSWRGDDRYYYTLCTSDSNLMRMIRPIHNLSEERSRWPLNHAANARGGERKAGVV